VARFSNIRKQTSSILASNERVFSCSTVLGAHGTQVALSLSSEANLMIRVTTAKCCHSSPILHEDWRPQGQRTPWTVPIHQIDFHAPVMLLCSKWESYEFAQVSSQGPFHGRANLQAPQLQSDTSTFQGTKASDSALVTAPRDLLAGTAA
jgi:hypothetical protein